MATVTSPEDFINLALDAIGYPRAIGDIYDGSPAARVALRVYGEARDAVFASQDWPFATARDLLANPVKTQTAAYGGNWDAATQPPPPWQYEFALPADFIRVMSVSPTPAAPGIQYNPQPYLWELADDATLAVVAGGNGERVLLTNFSPVILAYVSRMLDMTQWTPLFINALVAVLAQKLRVALGKPAPAQEG